MRHNVYVYNADCDGRLQTTQTKRRRRELETRARVSSGDR